MKILKVKLEGTAPIILHSDRLCNPLDPLTKTLKQYTSKRKKTDDDLLEIARIEWMGGLYYDESVGVYIPGQNVEATIQNSAKLQRRGQDVKRGLMVVEHMIPLEYDGPKKPEILFGDGDTEFVDMRSVVVQRARLMRCRPIFNKWAIEFSVGYNPEIFNKDDVIELIKNGGELIGLCDMRPRYGKFKVNKAA
jgi:hypothetical protein